MWETEIGEKERRTWRWRKGRRQTEEGEDWRRIEKALSFTCQSVLVGMSQSSLLLEA